MALGWFLATGARTLDRRLGLELLVRGLRVADATDREAQWVPPGLSVDTFANRYEGEQGVPALAIVDDGKVVGVLGPRRLRRLGRRKFAATRAADVMATPPAAPILSPDTELWTAMNDLNQAGIDALAVADDEGTLLGLMTRARLGEVIGKRMLEAEAARGSAGR
jgi:CBS domain-containing protein